MYANTSNVRVLSPGARLAVAAAAVVSLLAGCVSTGPRGELPFGEWVGQGTVVDEAWPQSGQGDQAAESHSVHRAYPTSLSIRPGRIDDREIIELEIFSERGHLGDDDEDARTHLKVALVMAKRVSDSAVLYRMVDFQYNPGPDTKLRFDDGAPPCTAGCITEGEASVFQIPYLEGFFDTIRFRGGRVEKWGVYFDKESGFIQWSERLTRRK